MAGTGTCPTLAKLLLGAACMDEMGMGRGGGGVGWVHSYSHVPRRNPLNRSYHLLTIGVGTGPAGPAAAGPIFSIFKK